MRMWMVNHTGMCRNHLMGEHVELHMLVGCLTKGKSIQGYIDRGLIDTSSIYSRHKELTTEIERRGYNHKSIIEDNDFGNVGRVDIDKSITDLHSRCKDCGELGVDK